MNVQDAKQPAIDFGARTSVGHQGDGTPSMTLDSRVWTLAFRPLMNRLKLFKIKFFSYNMERKTEEKQPLDLSKQPIVLSICQGFVVLSFYILFYLEQFCFISS